MRLFLALRLDSQMSKKMMAVLRDLKVHKVNGNYSPVQNLHITLVFIGETDRVPEIKEILGTIPVPEMRVSFEKLSMYKNILLADVKGNQKLKEYVAGVRGALDKAGIDYDHKKFMPHLTLVRKAGGNYKEVDFPKETMMVRHVSLMKSVNRDGRMVYTEIAGWDK